MTNNEYFGISEIGLVRKTNEDYFWCGKNEYNQTLLIVCDGVGGVFGGDIASKKSTETFVKKFMENDFEEKDTYFLDKWFRDYLVSVKSEFSNLIFDDEKLVGMSTTLTASIITNSSIFTFNVGDSRAYLIKKSRITQITEDHTVFNKLKKMKAPKEKWEKYKQNMFSITSSISFNRKEKEIDYDIYINDKKEADFLLLCTDGVYNFIDSKYFSKYKNNDTKEYCEKLIAETKNNLTNDNITICISRIE
jgi:PPM family protein phosphatase